MKTLVADINATDGIIRVHTPEKLTEQETAKSARAEVLKKRLIACQPFCFCKPNFDMLSVKLSEQFG